MKPITVTWDGGVRRVAESCTVHHTLTHQPDIAVELLDTPVTA